MIRNHTSLCRTDLEGEQPPGEQGGTGFPHQGQNQGEPSVLCHQCLPRFPVANLRGQPRELFLRNVRQVGYNDIELLRDPDRLQQ